MNSGFKTKQAPKKARKYSGDFGERAEAGLNSARSWVADAIEHLPTDAPVCVPARRAAQAALEALDRALEAVSDEELRRTTAGWLEAYSAERTAERARSKNLKDPTRNWRRNNR